MSDEHETNAPTAPRDPPEALVRARPPLSDAAVRALEEARARREAAEAAKAAPEVGGRGGLEPVRYGDWEVKGIASDF